MKILLFRPFCGANIVNDMIGDFGLVDSHGQRYPDLSLVYSASILKDRGIEFSVIDANAEMKLIDEINNRIDASFDIIIIKTAQATVKFDIEIGKYLKKQYPNTKIVLTGRSAYVLRDWIFENVSEIDEVPLMILEDYVYQLVTNDKRHLPLDEYPIIDYSLFPNENYFIPNGELRATLYASRGCIINCHYCPYSSLNNGLYEERSLDKLAADIEHILSLGFKHITFRDQYFTCNKERTLALCEMIKAKNLKFEWAIETRIDSLDKELIDTMVDAGMGMISFGIETRTKDILGKFGRPYLEFKHVKDIIDYLKSKNVLTLSLLILGFPGEEPKQMNDTFDYAVELGTTYANFNVWNSFIGTKTWDDEYSKYNTVNLDLFPLFKRKMDFNIPNRIDTNEVEFIAKHYEYKYIEKTRSLTDAYYDHTCKVNEKKRQIRGFKVTKSFLQQELPGLILEDEFLIDM